MIVTQDSTNVSVIIRIIDSTDGTPETGVVAATSGLILYYSRELAVPVSLATITDLAALTTAHTDKGILHIGGGYYRVDVPDAAFATGVDKVLIHGVADGMIVIGNEVTLGGVDVTAISGSTVAADRLEAGAKAVITGTVSSATDATQFLTDLESGAYTLTTDDQLVNRTIIFDIGTTTTALEGQSATITSYTGSDGTVEVATGAITTAPGAGDTFTIV